MLKRFRHISDLKKLLRMFCIAITGMDTPSLDLFIKNVAANFARQLKRPTVLKDMINLILLHDYLLPKPNFVKSSRIKISSEEEYGQLILF